MAKEQEEITFLGKPVRNPILKELAYFIVYPILFGINLVLLLFYLPVHFLFRRQGLIGFYSFSGHRLNTHIGSESFDPIEK